ncbi:MAG: hypothetical protein IT332_01320 [Ardenticatenales bacterium]|nr:hypothetical protein [Ardenticatenales bacterium]
MPDPAPAPPVVRREAPSLELLTLAVLMLAAAAARLALLGRIPPGLHVDEAFNILDARAVIDGWRPIFLPANAGRDVLYTYLQAPLLALLGDRLVVARSASALVGSLTVPLAWWMVRSIEPCTDASDGSDVDARRIRRTALTAAALLAATYWHLHFSRFGIRAILLPALVAALLARWSRAATADGPHTRRRAAVDSGILLGLAAYAHPAGRALIALPAAHALWRTAQRRDGTALRTLGIATAVGALIALPLAAQWLAHPWQATGHAVEVSILGGGLAAVADNAARVAGMFNVAGDAAMWRNTPGRPAFDVVSGAAFLVGLALAVRHALRGWDGAVLAVIALVGLALPSVLTDGAPNFSRAIGVLPVAAWLAAVGAVAVGDAVGAFLHGALARRGPPSMRLARLDAWVPVLVPSLVVALTAVSTARAYRAWAVDPAARIAFDADIEAFARWVDDLPAAPAVFTSPLTADHATYRAAAARPAMGVDAGHGLVVPVTADGEGRGEARYVDIARLPWTAEQGAALGRWADAGLPTIRLTTRVGAPSEAPADVGPVRTAVVGIDVREAVSRTPQPVRWDDAITFLEIALPTRIVAGSSVTATVAWRAVGSTDLSLSTAVQLNTAGGDGIANGDGLPIGGSYPTDRWRPGEIILSRHRLDVPADAHVGPAVLRLGWYALTYPDGPGAAPHVNPITDSRGRQMVGVASTTIVPPESLASPEGGG